MLGLFVAAFGIGLAFCAPPGAVTAEAVRRGIARGFRAALLLELGSLIGDATWATIALGGAAALVQNQPARLTLGGVGVALLAYLAFRALRDAWSGALPDLEDSARLVAARASGPATRCGDFAAGAALSLTNPLSIAYWLGIGAGSVASLVPQSRPVDVAVFFGGFLVACTLWCFLVAAVVGAPGPGRSLVRPTTFRVVNLVCGMALAYFALLLLGRLIGVA